MKHFLSLPAAFVLVAAFALATNSFAVEETPPSDSGESSAADTEDLDVDALADELDAADEAEKPKASAPKRGIEEIVIQAGESDAAGDFEAGDSVAAFDASDLEALGAQSIEDLAAFTPNLEIVTSGSTTPTFFIRGVGLNDFAANSSGAVAVYQNDVPLNAPALQLGTLFDVEAVNILRGPQGTGAFRNASAGAIKVYSRKPSGEFGGYFTSSFGNYNAMDFEGAVEAPVYEDILSARFAFRVTQRDGYLENGCGDAIPLDERGFRLNTSGSTDKFDANGDPLSLCGESVARSAALNPSGKSMIPEGLPTDINDSNNWAARATILFQPTLDMEWLLTAQGGRRDEQSRLGQAYGTVRSGFDPDCLEDLEPGESTAPCKILGILGSDDSEGYQAQEVKERLVELDPCKFINVQGQIANTGECTASEQQLSLAKAQSQVASELAAELDSDPQHVDVNRVGPTTNDVWGVALKGDMVLGEAVTMRTVSSYNTYNRFISTDLDFSPNQLFEFETTDTGWQLTQDLSFSGYVSEDLPIRWEVGGFVLKENLDVFVDIFLQPQITQFSVKYRDYQQDLLSAAGYASVAWDFWEDFTLDGGFRYNWEQKSLDYQLTLGDRTPPISLVNATDERIWQAPTGTARLTYRFREDTHAYFKYTRGWKGGHFNATGSGSNPDLLIEAAEPEQIDAFEAGFRGSWFNGRLGASFSTFYYDYENYQIFTARQLSGSPPEFVVINASAAEVYGAELDLIGRPLPGLYLQARLAWLDSQFLDFVQVNQSAEGVPVTLEVQNTGNPLLNSPKYKVSLTAEQTIPLGRYGTLTARWDGAWTDATNYDATNSKGTPNSFGDQFLPENTIGQEAFWIHNVRLAYRTPSGALEVAGWMRNVEDKAYKTFAFDANFQRTTIYFVGEPRTYGVSLTTTF